MIDTLRLKNPDSFKKEELEHILFRQGFKIGDIIHPEKIYYNKTPSTYIKFEYNHITLFRYRQHVEGNNFAFLELFIFSLYLNTRDRSFLNRNISHVDKCFLTRTKSMAELRNKIQKEIDYLDWWKMSSILSRGEKAKTTRITRKKEHYEQIIKQIDNFVL